MNRIHRFLNWLYSERIANRILRGLLILLFIALLAKWDRC
jgi:hypothetical protein